MSAERLSTIVYIAPPHADAVAPALPGPRAGIVRLMAELLDEDAVRAALDTLDGWAGDSQAITRTVKLPTFPAAISVVDEVAEVAERSDHHPDIDIRWR